MNEKYRVTRLKSWSSKEEREQHPTWLNPLHLRLDDADDLSNLIDPSRKRSSIAMIVDLAKNGGDMLVVRDTVDRIKSAQGRIVALVTFSVLPVLHGHRLVVTESFYDPHCCKETVRVVLNQSLSDIARQRNIFRVEYLPEATSAPIRRSGVNPVKQAERFEEEFESRLDDGPPTQKLALSAGRSKR